MSTPMMAANAYSRLANIGGASAGMPGLGSPGTSEGGGGFGAMLQNVLGSVGDAGTKADNQTFQAVQGKGDVVDIVTAVAESEVALETLVSVRDKVISAYEEIMRMPI